MGLESVVLLFLLGQTKAQDFKIIEANADFKIWTAESKNNDPIQFRLKSELPKLLALEIFKDRLPKPFSILIDPNLKTTMGFHSSKLLSPDGDPSIFLHPQAITNASEARQMRTLIHELIHLAHHQARPSEESWLREGLALMGEQAIQGKINPVYSHGLSEPNSSLTAALETDLQEARSKEEAKEALAQYGHLSLFFSFSFKHCGAETLLNKLLYSKSGESIGVQFMDQQLREFYREALPKFCKNFSDLFQQFEKARFMQNPSSIYSYVLITTIESPLSKAPIELKPYSANIYKTAESRSCIGTDLEIRDRVCLQIREN